MTESNLGCGGRLKTNRQPGKEVGVGSCAEIALLWGNAPPVSGERAAQQDIIQVSILGVFFGEGVQIKVIQGNRDNGPAID